MDMMSLFMMIMIQTLQTGSTAGKRRAENDITPFDNNTNAGYGANLYTSSIFEQGSGSLKYTRDIDTAEGPTIAGDNGKDLSMESVLAFSEMGLRTADGRFGNGNGEVSLAEFKNSLDASLSSTKRNKIAETIDTDADGIINRTELASYYLLVDEMDGNMNGKIKDDGIQEFNETVFDGDDSDKADLQDKLRAYQTQLASANSTFELDSPAVKGQSIEDGSYEGNDALAWGANAGEETRSLMGTNQLLFTDVQFLYGNTEEEKTQSGLAFATALLGGQEKVPVGMCDISAPDLDNDGYISADEVLATAMFQDQDGNGIITQEERLQFDKLINEGDLDIEDIEEIWEDKDLEDARIDDFEMPEKAESTENNSSNEIVEVLRQLIQMFFGIQM